MPWISAEDAIRRLGVKPQTLYAYVSRGRLEARPDPIDVRKSLYSLKDIDQLVTRRAGPRRAADIARDSIAWGEPVLASCLTTIARGRLCYRGKDAIQLAQTATLEQAASLFWDAPYSRPETFDPVPKGALKGRLFKALAARAGTDHHARGRSPAFLAAEAASLLECLVNAAVGSRAEGPIHERLSHAWGVDELGSDLIRRSLVLLLDHELNASTFSARVAASTGASLAACTMAGLSTLSGPLHGGAVDSALLIIREAERMGAVPTVRARLGDAGYLPGFGHPLYPDGDPRAAALLKTLVLPDAVSSLCNSAFEELDLRPNVDFAIGALALACDLPKQAPFAIFAIGRAIGWLGHAMEQLETGTVIRPRARYIGPDPEQPQIIRSD